MGAAAATTPRYQPATLDGSGFPLWTQILNVMSGTARGEGREEEEEDGEESLKSIRCGDEEEDGVVVRRRTRSEEDEEDETCTRAMRWTDE